MKEIPRKKKGNESDFSIKQNYIRIAIHTGNFGEKKKKPKTLAFSLMVQWELTFGRISRLKRTTMFQFVCYSEI